MIVLFFQFVICRSIVATDRVSVDASLDWLNKKQKSTQTFHQKSLSPSTHIHHKMLSLCSGSKRTLLFRHYPHPSSHQQQQNKNNIQDFCFLSNISKYRANHYTTIIKILETNYIKCHCITHIHYRTHTHILNLRILCPKSFINCIPKTHKRRNINLNTL